MQVGLANQARTDKVNKEIADMVSRLKLTITSLI